MKKPKHNLISPLRRGSIYVAVLGVALLVTVIGLSALLSVRVEHRAAILTEDAVRADFAAQSYVDWMVFTLNRDSGWRAAYDNDSWSGDEIQDEATCNFKLVDELDGDLVNDASQPVRLYGKATVGGAVRIYSVILESLVDEESGNLFSNGDMESGTANWSDFYCDIASSSTAPHEGSACLAAYSRWDWFSGPVQSVIDWVEDGETYEIEAWLRTRSTTDFLRPVIYLRTTDLQYTTGTSIMVDDTRWVKLSTTMTPVWAGELTEAMLGFCSQGGNSDFYVDDVVVKVAGAEPVMAMEAMPGTWRREVLETQILDPFTAEPIPK